MVKYYSKSRYRIDSQDAGSTSDLFLELPRLPLEMTESELAQIEMIQDQKLTIQEKVDHRIRERTRWLADLPKEDDQKLIDRRKYSEKRLLEVEEKLIRANKPLTLKDKAEIHIWERMVLFSEFNIPEDWLKKGKELVDKWKEITKGCHKKGSKVRLKREYRKECVNYDFEKVSEDNNFTGTLEEFILDDKWWEGIVVYRPIDSRMNVVRLLNMKYEDEVYGEDFPVVLHQGSDWYDLVDEIPLPEDLEKMKYYEFDPDCHFVGGMATYIPNGYDDTFMKKLKKKSEEKHKV